ncbi:MAG: hypothetical protein EOP06_23265 [Proteobacteria bacterium]|nr:MAG: hypothetical protein EOP06_23265 [Pseudomonadota bacterium]
MKLASRRLTAKATLGQLPIVVYNSEAPSPYVWGLTNPILVTNSYVKNCSDQEQVAGILSHEIAHIEGNDAAWLLLTHGLKRLFFFLPFSYALHRRHTQITEMAADEFAISDLGAAPELLLKSIVEIAEHCVSVRNRPLLLPAGPAFADLALFGIHSPVSAKRNDQYCFLDGIGIPCFGFAPHIFLRQALSFFNFQLTLRI